MPHSSVNSPDEDTELPDAPQSSPDEPSSDATLPKTEPQSDPVESPPTPSVKEEVKEEGDDKAKLEDLFTDDDEDFLGDDDGADLLAPEFKVVMYGIPHSR